MTFSPDLPVSGDTLGSTRDRIRGNFQQIGVVEAINHIAFNQSDQGKHKFLQMPEVTSSGAGVPVTLANEVGLYANQGTNPTEANLFMRGENNGFEYQLTNAVQGSTATFGNNTVYQPGTPTQFGGWTFLPGGLLMQYGRNVFLVSNSSSVVFPVPFSDVFTLNYSTTKFDPTRISSLTPTGFTLQANPVTPLPFPITYYWTAIGRAV